MEYQPDQAWDARQLYLSLIMEGVRNYQLAQRQKNVKLMLDELSQIIDLARGPLYNKDAIKETTEKMTAELLAISEIVYSVSARREEFNEAYSRLVKVNRALMLQLYRVGLLMPTAKNPGDAAAEIGE